MMNYLPYYIFKLKLTNKRTITYPIDPLFGGKSTAQFTRRAFVAGIMRDFISFCIVYPCSCYYAFVMLLSLKSRKWREQCCCPVQLSTLCHTVVMLLKQVRISWKAFHHFEIQNKHLFRVIQIPQERHIYISVRVNINPSQRGGYFIYYLLWQ